MATPENNMADEKSSSESSSRSQVAVAIITGCIGPIIVAVITAFVAPIVVPIIVASLTVTPAPIPTRTPIKLIGYDCFRLSNGAEGVTYKWEYSGPLKVGGNNIYFEVILPPPCERIWTTETQFQRTYLLGYNGPWTVRVIRGHSPFNLYGVGTVDEELVPAPSPQITKCYG